MFTHIFNNLAKDQNILKIRNSGYLIHDADKAVKKGIDDIKSSIVYIDSQAKNTWKEFENYKFKKIGDKITDEVVKLWDDSMDALRYGVRYIKKNKLGGGIQVFRF